MQFLGGMICGAALMLAILVYCAMEFDKRK